MLASASRQGHPPPRTATTARLSTGSFSLWRDRALLHGLGDLPGLEVAELYALYPDGRIDFKRERERVLRADRLVLQFPLCWYSTPPLLKHWEDAVLTPLFHLEPDIAASTAGLPLLAATTTGGVSDSYQPGGATGMTIDELFAPLRATARKCGWLRQPPFALHDVRTIDDAALALAAGEYRSAILSTPTRERRREVAACTTRGVVRHSALIPSPPGRARFRRLSP